MQTFSLQEFKAEYFLEIFKILLIFAFSVTIVFDVFTAYQTWHCRKRSITSFFHLPFGRRLRYLVIRPLEEEIPSHGDHSFGAKTIWGLVLWGVESREHQNSLSGFSVVISKPLDDLAHWVWAQEASRPSSGDMEAQCGGENLVGRVSNPGCKRDP